MLEQILSSSTIKNVWRTVWRRCMLMLGLKTINYDEQWSGPGASKMWELLAQRTSWNSRFFFQALWEIHKQKSLSRGYCCFWSSGKSSMRRSVSSPDETPSIFNELRGVSSGDETLCRMLDITSHKGILEEEIKDAKMSSFSSDFQTLIKH